MTRPLRLGGFEGGRADVARERGGTRSGHERGMHAKTLCTLIPLLLLQCQMKMLMPPSAALTITRFLFDAIDVPRKWNA